MRNALVGRRSVRRTVGLSIATVLLAAPAVVFAAHQFPDVPNGHPFHAEIGAIADAGITAGFNDGNYHPGDAVTRQAMAAFMHRGFGRVGHVMNASLVNSTLPVAMGDDFAPGIAVRAVGITVPGQNSAFTPEQMVYVRGRIVFYTPMSTAADAGGCPCEFFARIRDVEDNNVAGVQNQTFWVDESYATTSSTFGFDVDALFVAPPGIHNFQLEVGLSRRTDASMAYSYALDTATSLAAMTFPFGPSGGNTPF